MRQSIITFFQVPITNREQGLLTPGDDFVIDLDHLASPEEARQLSRACFICHGKEAKLQ